jgi:6-phosphogluconolactonase (cycloisomerase 2 family)
MKLLVFVCLLAILPAIAAPQKQFVYTDNEIAPINTVTGFQVSDGTLTQISGSPFSTKGEGGQGPTDAITVATTLSGFYLFAANDGDGTVSAFTIDSTTGNLTIVSGSPFLVDGPATSNYSLASSPNGQFLFVTSDATEVIHVYSISTSGGLSEVSGSPFQTGANNDGLKVSPNGYYLVAGESSLNSVGVFAISSTGSIKPVAGSPFSASGTVNSVDVNCASRLVFAASNDSTFIDAYQMASDGGLTPSPGSPFENGTASNSFSLVLSPSGRFLFATDSFSDDVSSMTVAPDGELAPVPGSPFNSKYWEGGIAVSQQGDFVYSAAFAYTSVVLLRVGADGVLTYDGRFPTNQFSMAGELDNVASFPPPSCPAVSTF